MSSSFVFTFEIPLFVSKNSSEVVDKALSELVDEISLSGGRNIVLIVDESLIQLVLQYSDSNWIEFSFHLIFGL
ncbi:hypothetical protein BB559_002398 [Furculomyces boomerangus]|uniref:Uncharacterized protein n=1 Tax=Furculomyces boomerangus TaxID=61424 RepID=A0A2T9YVS2_9FUNG|nr:hypothetical protein BB559_004166 [Furculomyces boomerangus]PVU96386.1 hypothetical protein BB559_002398 [Furculomyces boomerangus]